MSLVKDFHFFAQVRITEAYCNNSRCNKKGELFEVSPANILYCPNCDSIYMVKLERVDVKTKNKLLKVCKRMHELENLKREATLKFIEKKDTNN